MGRRYEYQLRLGRVTVGLVSHWPCVTDISGLSTYGINGLWKGDEHFGVWTSFTFLHGVGSICYFFTKYDRITSQHIQVFMQNYHVINLFRCCNFQWTPYISINNKEVNQANLSATWCCRGQCQVGQSVWFHLPLIHSAKFLWFPVSMTPVYQHSTHCIQTLDSQRQAHISW